MLLGQTIGPFTIESELGSGAMGTVYKARLLKDSGKVVPVAFKIVSVGLAGNDGALARFDREAAILKQLKHPHIVRLLATGRYQKTPFIAMEFVDGESLDRTLLKRTRLDWDEVAAYGKQLCSALQHAHDTGIVHRDLKPSNLMVTRDGVLKLTDFGIAKDTDVTALTGHNSTIGTAAYMSPEQCRGDKTLGPKSDLYSLGVCLYELLTGRKPFTAENTVEMFLKHVNEAPTRPRRLVPDVPVWFDNLVMFCLEKNKENRPLDAATVGKMIADIEEKVRSQQSVGAEVANARRVDRPVGAAPVGEADKEAARSLRDKPGKKKRKKPAARKRWSPAVVIAAVGGPVVALLAVAAYFLSGPAAPPESAEAAFARVMAVEPPADRAAAAVAFLAKFPAGPQADQARQVVRDAAADRTEAAVVKRYNSAFSKNSDNYEPAAYDLARKALDAEAAGQLKDAADLWTRCRDACPPGPADGTLPGDDDVPRVALGWAADRRAKVVRDGVPALAKALAAKLAEARKFELETAFDPADPDAVAVRALVTEQFPDRPRAKLAWDRLATLTKPDPDRLPHTLLAARQAAALAGDKDADPAARLKRVTDRVAELEAKAAGADAADAPLAVKRDARNGCRDVLAVYGDEPGDDLKPAVERAKKLLAALAKPAE